VWGEGTLPTTVDGSLQVKSGYGVQVPERGTLARYYDCTTKRTGGACTGQTDIMVMDPWWQLAGPQNTKHRDREAEGKGCMLSSLTLTVGVHAEKHRDTEQNTRTGANTTSQGVQEGGGVYDS
jgi:hypothetical protein